MDFIVKRADELPLGTPAPGDIGVYYDKQNNVTKGFLMDQFLTSDETQNFQWVPSANDGSGYIMGEFVTYGGKWFESLVNNNLNVPGTDETKWLEGSKVYGTLRVWQAGLYTESEEFVIGRNAQNHLLQWRLASTAGRPFNSSNFLNEVAAGSWEAISKSYIDSVAVYNLTSPTTITQGHLLAGSNITGMSAIRILELILTGDTAIKADNTIITADDDTKTADSL
jgi:hypothetical protein